MARLFNAYVIVDWSAAESKADHGFGFHLDRRPQARRALFAWPSSRTIRRRARRPRPCSAGILDDRAKHRERTPSSGFDFALGFPRGLAAGLHLPGEEPWRAVWTQIDRMVTDKADNTNNASVSASEINRR